MLNSIDLARVDLNLLVLFQAVLEERHVGRAAQALNLSPSAVSHALGRLRRMLNDPLFLKTPKGVVPTERAAALAEPIADILARARAVVATAAPFEPRKSRRRFTIGLPDAVAAVLVPRLLERVEREAPGIDLSIRHLLPAQASQADTQPWAQALAAIESRALDMAVVPLDAVPPRFAARPLYQEDFVVAMRSGHPFARNPTLERYCSMRHLLVSSARDDRGFVDAALAARGHSRRIAVALPNFLLALSMLAQSDLLAALPRSLLKAHGRRFGLVSREIPVELPISTLRAVTTRAAMNDAGVAWMFEALVQAVPPQARRCGKQ